MSALQVPVQLCSFQALQTLGQGSHMPCELWILPGPDPDAALDADAGSATFIGVASAPLAGTSVASDVASTLAAGWHTLSNVLEGSEGGTVRLQLTLVPDSVQHPSNGAEALQRPGSDAASCAEVCAGDQADGLVVHAFRVSIRSVGNLPNASEVLQAREAVPEGRYIRCAHTLRNRGAFDWTYIYIYFAYMQTVQALMIVELWISAVHAWSARS